MAIRIDPTNREADAASNDINPSDQLPFGRWLLYIVAFWLPPIGILVGLIMWLKGGKEAIIGKVMLIVGLVPVVLFAALVAVGTLFASHSAPTPAAATTATTIQTTSGESFMNSSASTPGELMADYAMKYNAGGYAITSAQLASEGWKAISVTSDLTTMPTGTVVVYYTNASGKHRVGFDPFGQGKWQVTVLD